MALGTQESRASGGRPMDPARDDALRRAAVELIAEIGYDRMTIEAVASRARAGKATVYRRWPSKADLVIDAFVNDTLLGGAPDTGSLRGDVVALSQRMWGDEGRVNRARVMAGVVSAMLAHPELRQAMASYSRPPQALVDEVIGRAVERGEIAPPADMDVVGTIIPGMCMFRLAMTGEPPTPEFVETVVDRVLLPVLGGKS